MKKSLNLFFQSLHEIQLFLKLTESPSGELNEKIILRSIIVLMVAAWEQFIEQLAEKSVLSLTNHLRDSNPIPEKVKQSIAIFTVPENRSNLRGFSNSVWNFSEKGWKKAYHDYCIFNSKELNTASSKNIKRFFENIIGIKDITSNWKYNNLTSVECANKLDDLIDLRHDIAHGANIRQNELNIKNTTFYNNFLREISSLTFDQTFNWVSNLSQLQALTYTINQSCFVQIIKYAVTKKDRVLTLNEIKRLGSSAQGNHNKLKYEPWGLLEDIDSKTRRVTERLLDFYKGKISLPLNIIVYDNDESDPIPNTQNVFFSDIDI